LAIRSKDISAIYELLYNPNFIPRRSPDAHIDLVEIEGRPTYILIKESDHENFEVDEDTGKVWQLLDGNRTVREVCEAVAKVDESITEKDVKDIIASLAEEGAIETTEIEVEKKRVEVESAFQININLVENSSESLKGVYEFLKKYIRLWELYVAVGVSLVGAVLFAGTFVQVFSTRVALEIAGSALLGYFVYQLFILLPVYAVHELAHGAVCYYYGAKPTGMGTGLYYLAPFFYCDTSDAWKLPRRARIMISLAGPVSEVTISAVFVFLSYFVTSGFAHTVLIVGAFLGFYATIINLSPIIETDGYYILTDLLNIPNLRDETFGFIKKGVLSALGRPVSKVRRSARIKRIFYLYAVTTFGWLAIFVYTTAHIFSIYGGDAYTSLVTIGLTVLGQKSFNIVGIGVSIASLAYFALLMGGFAVMGSVAYRRVRYGGAKLETIHDKRVTVFMPVPSFIHRDKASKLVRKSRSLARKFTRSCSVTLEPPFCVAALKLGKVDETLERTRESMSRVESSFRSMHASFLAAGVQSKDLYAGKMWLSDNLRAMAGQLSGAGRVGATSGVADFVHRRIQALRTVLLSGFGTVWTLELVPEDFRRLRKQIFPALIAEDLGGAGLSPDLEAFKKRVVFGPEALSTLSAQVEEESSEVFKNPEVYQTAAFLEPIGSKLVFAGRTDKVEGSVLWLGGVFLYQAWIGFIREALDDAAIGLRSLRALPTAVTKAQVTKLSQEELKLLREDFGRLEALHKAIEESMTKIESTYQSALNFHETLQSLVADEGFDVGLYTPILNANQKRLEGVREGLNALAKEWSKTYEKFHKAADAAEEEASRRGSQQAQERATLGSGFRSAVEGLRGRKPRSQPFEAEVKLVYSASRLMHDVVAASDVVL
jgi:hypothetical protein